MRENDKNESNLTSKNSARKISTRKDKKKLFRGILQGAFLAFVVYLALSKIFTFDKYDPYTEVSNEDKGFIAVSYFGAADESEGKLIGEKDLDEHLTALKNQGYVTITQQDVIDYYKEGKPLPERALYLMFEDSRSDTGVYAHDLLVKHNLIATMFSYGNSFEKRDSKFIKGSDMVGLRESSYWELATNGYRLEYINVFEYEDQFVGQLTPLEYLDTVTDVDAIYNHYLMDYIRDENSIPLETYDAMKERIDYDYRKMKELYESEVGGVPAVYGLIHSDTGQFGSNDNVSDINEEWIYSLFEMNFNRSGYSLNTRENSIYDLTRIQPKPHWSTNHLLMRISDDIKQELDFVEGDTNQKEQWEISKGVAEFKDKQIVLTSTPYGEGLMRLKDSEQIKDVHISVILKGNKTGSESIYLRANEDFSKGVKIEVIEDKLKVYEAANGEQKEIVSIDLESIEGEYPELEEMRSRLFEISLEENNLSIKIDKEIIIDEQIVESNEAGSIYLESKQIEQEYIKRGLADEIYDARFEDFVITQYTETDDEKIIFDNRLKGVNKWLHEASEMVDSVIDWFIDNL